MQFYTGRAVGYSLFALAALAVIAGCKEAKTTNTPAASGSGEAVAAATQQPPPASATAATTATPTPDPSASQSPTEKAIAKAAGAGRYAFVLFHRSGGSSGSPMQDSFDQAKAELQSRAVFVKVDVSKGTDAQLIDKYGIDRAPLPLILALAPNGAVTKAFTEPADAAALRKAFVSPVTARMLGVLQDGKLVALCVQGENTQHNEESMSAAREFVADESIRGQAEVMRLDPGDRDEAPLLDQCNLSPTLKEASIVLLVPPSSLVATVSGATTKAKLLSALQQGLAACGSGCGPSGCG
jgi:hypothetical protein